MCKMLLCESFIAPFAFVLVTSRKVQYTLFLKKDVFWDGELNRK
jgi:hypothetical protein